ncbi:hypothetical protein OOZ58_42130, partial [Streptomyces tauricus]|nr:hypothetical protein [Streptomyces tauricus]
MSPENESTADVALRFSVLGPLRAWRHATELSLGPPKQRLLLALLLVRSDRPVPLHQIVDALDNVSFGGGSRCVGMTSLAEHLVSDELWELFR